MHCEARGIVRFATCGCQAMFLMRIRCSPALVLLLPAFRAGTLYLNFGGIGARDQPKYLRNCVNRLQRFCKLRLW